MIKHSIPKLRFPGFSDEWEDKKLGDVATFLDGKRIPLSQSDRQKRRGKYPYYGASGIIDYVDDYIFDGEYILLGEDGANIIMRNSRLAFIAKGKFWVNNHAHILQAKASNYFLSEYLERLKYDDYNTGTAQPKLNSAVCKKIDLRMPIADEQHKIADFLGVVDGKTAALQQKKVLLEKYKKGIMQKIFSQEIRFKERNGQSYPTWQEKKFDDCLQSLTTKNFQIQSSEFKNAGNYPVVDQGQGTIAGYSDREDKLFTDKPVIIFGDHTTFLKYINFNFVLGADGTKILKSMQYNLKYLFYYLQHNQLIPEGYKRHFSSLRLLQIALPIIAEQQKIADFLTSIDEKIEAEERKLEQTKQFKKALLQQMFV